MKEPPIDIANEEAAMDYLHEYEPLRLYRKVKAGERLPIEPIEITEEEIKSLYKVIHIAEEERFICGEDDDIDVFNTYMILRKLTGIDGDLSKLKS